MRIALLAILGGVFCIASEAYARQWQDASGTYKVEAELVSSANGNVWLKKQDGQVVCVPINQLSVLDREFVRTHAGQQPQPAQAAPAPPNAGQFSLVDLTAKVEPAVVRIDAGGAIGSGFVVDPAGSVITNFHVIEGARSAKVSFKDGTTSLVQGFLGGDVDKDIVLLRLLPAPPRTALPLRHELPRKGETVAPPSGHSGAEPQPVVKLHQQGQESGCHAHAT